MQSTTIVLNIGFFLLCFTTLKLILETPINNTGLLLSSYLLASSPYQVDAIYDDNATQQVSDD